MVVACRTGNTDTHYQKYKHSARERQGESETYDICNNYVYSQEMLSKSLHYVMSCLVMTSGSRDKTHNIRSVDVTSTLAPTNASQLENCPQIPPGLVKVICEKFR